MEGIKVGLLLSEKFCVVCVMENPLKIIKNVFYFVLKALLLLKIFKFLSQHFGYILLNDQFSLSD